MDVEVKGVDKLRRVARQLREAGDKALQQELYAGLNRAVKPLRGDAVRNLGEYLPSGYAPEVEGAFSTKVGGSRGRDVKVSVTATARGSAEKRDLSALNAGVLRHPVYGRYRFVKASRKSKHRDVRYANPWVAQGVRAGFFDDAAKRLAPEVAAECERVLDEVAAKIEGGL